MEQRIKIIYVYDAFCGWCYGFSRVIKDCYEKHVNDFDFEVISGGMMTGEKAGSINQAAPYSKTAYHTIEGMCGVKFGEPYLKHLEEGTMILNSEIPSIALSVFKSVKPQLSVPFVHDLQQSIYFDGKDPNDFGLYRYLAVNFGIDPDEFENKMRLEEFKEAAYYDFALAKQLRVESFPAVLMQLSETSFYLIAKGYTDPETLELRINNVIKEAGI
ncbi:DsbA family protein [Daejeonella sp. H1SJ63]|uniref:DsbA family protein n=1 Tax=Daejeonella sp. H1SJ63 TaxID=3034145 RepID=UPI0023EBB266|nr:DsbA family protein [Daejeonella sp. H1SJ63]